MSVRDVTSKALGTLRDGVNGPDEVEVEFRRQTDRTGRGGRRRPPQKGTSL